MLEQIHTEAEGKQQLVFFKQRATHVDIQSVGEVVSQDLESAGVKKELDLGETEQTPLIISTALVSIHG